MSLQILPDPQRMIDAGPDSYVVLIDRRVVRHVRIQNGLAERASLAGRLCAAFDALLTDGLGRTTAARAVVAWYVR